MLRDRMPKMLDLALRHCKAKQRWIDYVYENFVKRCQREKRSTVVKKLLGIKQQYKRQEIYDNLRYVEFKNVTMEQINSIPKSALYMSFSETINWQKLSVEDHDMYEYWKVVAGWVEWFSKMHIPVKDTYDHCNSWNMSHGEIVGVLMSKYGITRNTAEFIIKSFK